MNLFELAAKLTLDSSQYEEGLHKAQSATSKIGGMVKGALGSIAKIGTAAIGAAAGGLVAFAKSGVEAAAEFEGSFAQLSTIMDETQMNASKMQAGLMEMSSRMGISASELAETTYNAISATGDTAGSLAIVENATKLATAGFTDTSSALSVLTTAMNSYKMSAEETETISNSLIAVQNLGVTTVSELASSMGKAIASASAYSVDLYNLESAYVSLTKSGINTAESTTYISSMMKELGSDSTKVAKIVKSKTGKSFADLMKDGKSLGDVLAILNESVDGDANALMNLWSSAEAGKASNAILSQGLEQFNDNLVSIRDSAGLTEKAYGKMTNTLKFRTEKLKTNFNNLKIAFGTNLLPGVGDFIDLLTNGLGEITNAVQAGDWDAAFGILGETIGQGLSKAVENIPGLIDAAKSILKSLGKGLNDNADLILDSIFDGIGAVLGVGTDGEDAKEFGKMAGQFVIKLATKLADNLPEYINAAENIVSGIATGFSKARQEYYDNGGESLIAKLAISLGTEAFILADKIIESLNEALIKKEVDVPEKKGFLEKWLGDPLDPNDGSELIGNFLGMLAAGAGFFEKYIAGPIRKVWEDDIVAPIKEFGQTLQQYGDFFEDVFDSVGSYFSSVGEKIAGVWSSIVLAFSLAKESIATAIDNINLKIQGLKDWFAEKIDAVKEKIDEWKAKFDEFLEKVSTVFTDVETYVQEKIDAAKSWGSNLISGFVGGIQEAWRNLKSKVSGVVDTIKGLFTGKGGFDEHSPSKWAKKVFGYVLEGGIEGFDQATPSLVKTAGETVSAVQDMFDNAVEYTPTISAEYGRTSDSMTFTDKRLDRVISLLETYLPEMGHIELDGEIISTNVDTRLGQLSTMKARV